MTVRQVPMWRRALWSHAVVWPLLPVLVWQGRRVRARTVRLPDAAGGPSGEAGGGNNASGAAVQLLVVGESVVAGVGAARLEQALVGQLAAHLAAGLGKSVGWHAVGVTGARLAELLPRVASCAAARVDVCVVAAGVNDTTGLTSPRRYARDVRRVVEEVRARFGAGVPVVLAGVPPMGRFPALPQPLRLALGTRAALLDGAAQAAARGLPRVRHVPTVIQQAWGFCEDGYHPGPRGYAAWGQDLARHAQALLEAR